MYWALVFLAVAMSALPFALGAPGLDGAASLVTAVFGALSVASAAAHLLSRLR